MYFQYNLRAMEIWSKPQQHFYVHTCFFSLFFVHSVSQYADEQHSSSGNSQGLFPKTAVGIFKLQELIEGNTKSLTSSES